MTDAADRIVWEADEEALYRAARATEMAAQPQGAPEGVPAVQGAREARTERIAKIVCEWEHPAYDFSRHRDNGGHYAWHANSADAIDALVDAEVAAAVSEAQAEVERTTTAAEAAIEHANLRRMTAEAEVERLLSLVGDEDRPGWDGVSRAEAIRQANEFHAGQLRWIDEHDKRRSERDEARAEVERLREGIRALADDPDWANGHVSVVRVAALLDPLPIAGHGDQGSHSRLAAWGGAYRDETDLPSPAATTGEARPAMLAPSGPQSHPADATYPMDAPVSSGEAATGEAVDPEICPPSQRKDGRHSWKFDGDDPYIICHYCDEMQDARTGRIVRPAPVVTPSDEGSE